jgi:ATP-dependent Clp protease protease subunit
MVDLAGRKTAYYSFTGLIEPGGVTRIAAALNHAVNNLCDDAYLCINSQGGYVEDGIFLYNHIRGLPIKVIMHNTGSVASIAVTVFIAAEERYCSQHGTFLIHPTSMPAREGMTWERLRTSLDAALAEDQRTEDILRQRTTLPDDILSARRMRDVQIAPQDAVKFGLVSDIREFALPGGQQIIQV